MSTEKYDNPHPLGTDEYNQCERAWKQKFKNRDAAAFRNKPIPQKKTYHPDCSPNYTPNADSTNDNKVNAYANAKGK